jgi:hypothetical protein
MRLIRPSALSASNGAAIVVVRDDLPGVPDVSTEVGDGDVRVVADESNGEDGWDGRGRAPPTAQPVRAPITATAVRTWPHRRAVPAIQSR